LVLLFFLFPTKKILSSEKLLLINVLIKSNQSIVEFTHEKGVEIQLNQKYSFDTQKTIIRSFSENSPNETTYFVTLQGELPILEAIELSTTLLKTNLKNSELCLFLREGLSQFLVLLGPFPKKSDAEFVMDNLNPFYRCLNVVELPPDKTFAVFEIKPRLLLSSSIVSSKENTKAMTLFDKSNSIGYQDKKYPNQMDIYCCKNQKISVVNQTDMETYLLGVVPTEMPDTWNLEALKAQSVISRTFAYYRSLQAKKSGSYFDVTNDTFSQVYWGKRSSLNAPTAIKATKDEILTFQNRPIDSVFHSTSGGYTENNDKIWNGSPYAYLRAVPSPGEEISPHFAWCKKYTRDDFIKLLNSYLVSEKRNTIKSIRLIEIKEKGESPRVRKVSLETDIGIINLSGSEIQEIYSLKSTWFDFLIFFYQNLHSYSTPLMNFFINNQDFNQKNNQSICTIYIYGRGWGHGVGLSQYGALAQARKGLLYPEILSKFFVGTSLSNVFRVQNTLLQSAGFSTCSLSFKPSEVKLNRTDFVDLTIRIKTSQSIFGCTFDIVYPRKAIELPLQELREGTFLRSDGKSTIFQKTDTGSEIKIALSREGRLSGGVSGEGDLFFLRIKGIDPGEGKIEIKNLKVLDPSLVYVSSDSSDCLFTIANPDTIAPKTSIINYPDTVTNKKMILFEWSGSDDQTETEDLLFSYRINEEPWSDFSKESSHYFNLVSDGKYVFSVKARDEAGNVDPFPPFYNFFVDITPPKLLLNRYPEKTYLEEIVLSGLTEPNSTLLINGKTAPLTLNGSFSYTALLDIGKNIVRFIAIDTASNATTLDVLIERSLVSTVIISMTIGSKKALRNDQLVTLESEPFLKDGRTLVPLRFIAEAFGAVINWNSANQQIQINLQHPLFNRKIDLWVGNRKALVDNKEYLIDTPPFTVPPGRTMVPIRFIAEAFDSIVEWYPQTRGIRITFPKSNPGK